MTAAFKFLRSSHIDQIVKDGCIRIASLDYYRNIEGQQWIGDRHEGLVEVNYREPITITGNQLDRITPLYAIPTMSVGSGGTIIVSNVIHAFSTPNVYIFCAASGELDPLTNVMCRQGEDPYDGCVRIDDMQLLMHRIKHRGTVVEYENAKVRDVFHQLECKLVTYGNVVRDQSEGKPPPMGFLKDVIFFAQSEIRIALYPSRSIDTPTLTIKIPSPHTIFTEEFRFLETK
jgi:hypothetical protein